MTRPVIIGLTGSIGMGKSTVASMFQAAGIPVFDADAEVRAMQGPDGELNSVIEKAFPGSTGPNGVDRDALGKLVFGDKEALERLEDIVHPAVGKKRMQFLSDNADAPIIVFDIPLLFEGGGNESVDVVVVVSAPAEAQRKRVLARANMTSEKFEHILTLQVPDAEKRERADYVIDTGTTLNETRAQVEALLETITVKRD
ncbi:dephospho-CoA kinase [Erythrobacter crassostreae]|uniref:Dephospho-CoA kinase n=1 Tax=Erythrobacter crassostreae TaxID=2828328 RepID=A0A9X1JMB4_9SPHN|nr:dephospho-CoA kinase [Erythrobacter crassostrea]MBV7258578.1 dephospho-CoA kinase [Erythrobacter crassostrea]